MQTHKESMLRLEDLGTTIPSYHPTFNFQGKFINETHKYFATCPVKGNILVEIKTQGTSGSIIEGWLRREDAQKIYEIAYFVWGTYWNWAPTRA